MVSCEYRAKPGLPEACGLIPEVGSKYCPRHRFLVEMEQAKRDKKDGSKARAIGKAVENTRRALITLGYVFTGNGECRDCKAPVEWWKTPAGKSAPFNSMPNEDSKSISHFATCKYAHHFRKVS